MPELQPIERLTEACQQFTQRIEQAIEAEARRRLLAIAGRAVPLPPEPAPVPLRRTKPARPFRPLRRTKPEKSPRRPVIERIVALAKKGKSPYKIGLATGVSERAVRTALRYAGWAAGQ